MGYDTRIYGPGFAITPRLRPEDFAQLKLWTDWQREQDWPFDNESPWGPWESDRDDEQARSWLVGPDELQQGRNYQYEDWLPYLIDWLAERGYTLNGSAEWEGDEPDDVGRFEVEDNRLQVLKREVRWTPDDGVDHLAELIAAARALLDDLPSRQILLSRTRLIAALAPFDEEPAAS